MRTPQRWLVTGAGGMLGRRVVEVLNEHDIAMTALTRHDLDITHAHAVRDAVAQHDVVINAAGWTNVVGAEHDREAALRVNANGVANLAIACEQHNAKLIHVSTDYVFSGDECPYVEESAPGPINAYGYSKLVGEYAVFNVLPETGCVVRTAWLYDSTGENFVTTMLRLAKERQCLNVVANQWGHPTWARTLAERLVALGVSQYASAGVYHGVSWSVATWYEFAREIFSYAGLDPDRICPVTSAEYSSAVARPMCTVLDSSRWTEVGLEELPHWRKMLTRMMIESGSYV